MSNPVVTIEMENGDIIKAELYPEVAPNTVNNFISLVKNKFYDGVIFHRVIRGFMIQGGDPQDERRSQRSQAYSRRPVDGARNGAQFRRQPVLHHA